METNPNRIEWQIISARTPQLSLGIGESFLACWQMIGDKNLKWKAPLLYGAIVAPTY